MSLLLLLVVVVVVIMSFSPISRSSFSRFTSASFTRWNFSVRYFSFHCPPASPVESLECMNRNKRRVNPANHGARPCNSVGRKSRTMKAGGWNPMGLRPMQTRKPVKPHGMVNTQIEIKHQ